MTTETPLAAIILAAGKGTRMKSRLHKVLHPIAGRPMLGHLVDAVDRLGAAERVVVVGAEADQVEAFARPLGLEVARQTNAPESRMVTLSTRTKVPLQLA